MREEKNGEGVMSREEQLQGSKRVLGGSPSLGSPVRSRLYGAVGPSPRQQLQRSGQSAKKPPEPLRRAVAECLSSSVPNVHGSASAVTSEAARTLRVRTLLFFPPHFPAP